MFKIIDDILVTGKSVEDLVQNCKKVLTACRENNITLSPGKAMAGNKVKFAGMLVSDVGVQPDADKVAAIRDFPRPQNITDLRSYFGLVNQLGSFVPDLSHALQPLRCLLKKDTMYKWQPEHTAAYEESKKILTSPLLVHHFDPKLPTELLTDASRLRGLGFLLIQRDKKGHPRLITCGSRSLQPCETRYSVIELEALGLAFSILKCSFYLKGMSDQFLVKTDHRSLEGLWKKHIDEVENPRLQRLMNKVAGYNFKVEWVPGSKNQAADCLSRQPLWSPQEEDVKTAAVIASVSLAADQSLSEMIQQASEDEDYQRVINAFESGKSPASLPPNHPARAHANVWSEILLQDGLMCLGTRIIVPQNMRKKVLHLLHKSHPGFARMKTQLQTLYYFPGMVANCKTLVKTCEQCQRLQPLLPAEPLLQTVAQYPMEQVSVDLASGGGNDYLVMADRFSGFIFSANLKRLDTAEIIKHMRAWFLDFGLPKVIRSDGGPQFRSEFIRFCKEIGAEHELSSVQFPRSNGHGEAAIKCFKQMAEKLDWKWKDIQEGMREMRNTPRSGMDTTPAEAMFGRKQRTLLPIHPEILSQKVQPENVLRSHEKLQSVKKSQLDRNARKLPPFKEGEKVRLYNYHTRRWDQVAKVTKIREHGRSYHVDDGNRILLRNRRYLRPFHQVDQSDDSADNDGKEVAKDIRSRPGKLEKSSKDSPDQNHAIENADQQHNLKPILKRSERIAKQTPAIYSQSPKRRKAIRFAPSTHN